MPKPTSNSLAVDLVALPGNAHIAAINGSQRWQPAHNDDSKEKWAVRSPAMYVPLPVGYPGLGVCWATARYRRFLGRTGDQPSQPRGEGGLFRA